MQGTVDGFSYGLVTPVAAFLMACLGAALGLRRTARPLRERRPWKPAALLLGAASIGSGVWTMHFIAMMGFTVAEVPVDYDGPTVFAGLGVGTLMIGIGIFIVGRRGSTPMGLATGGTVTGLGIATMHFLCMAGLRLRGHLEYDTVTVVLSVLIAVAAAVTALWAVAAHRGLGASLAGGLLMGGAATGMHYTAMAAADVHLAAPAATAATGGADARLLPMLLGPAVFLLLAAVIVLFEPRLLLDAPDRPDDPGRPAGRRPRRTGPLVRGAVPAQRTRRGRQPGAGTGRAAGRTTAGRGPHGRSDLHEW